MSKQKLCLGVMAEADTKKRSPTLWPYLIQSHVLTFRTVIRLRLSNYLAFGVSHNKMNHFLSQLL